MEIILYLCKVNRSSPLALRQWAQRRFISGKIKLITKF